MENLQDTPSLPQPRNFNELELLKNYNNYIVQRVNELRLHPDHKEDLKEVLLQAMIQITLNFPKVNVSAKPQHFLFRLLSKTTG